MNKMINNIHFNCFTQNSILHKQMDQSVDEHTSQLVEQASQISPNHIYPRNNTENLKNKAPNESV